MAPRKTVKSLYNLSLEIVTSSMKEASNSLQFEDYVTDKIDEIRTYYGNLPEEIQQNLVDKLLHIDDDNYNGKDDEENGMKIK